MLLERIWRAFKFIGLVTKVKVAVNYEKDAETCMFVFFQLNEEETSLFDVLWLLLASVIFVPIFQKLPGGESKLLLVSILQFNVLTFGYILNHVEMHHILKLRSINNS